MGRARHSARNSLRSAANILSIQSQRMNCPSPISIRYLPRKPEPYGGSTRAKLEKYLPEPGSPYKPIGEGTVKLNPSLRPILQPSCDFSEGDIWLGFSYSSIHLLAEGDAEQCARLVTEDRGRDTRRSPEKQKTFSWTGAPEDIQVTTSGVQVLNRTVARGQYSSLSLTLIPKLPAPPTTLNGSSVKQQPVIVNGKEEFYSYQLQVNGFNPFRQQSGLACAAYRRLPLTGIQSKESRSGENEALFQVGAAPCGVASTCEPANQALMPGLLHSAHQQTCDVIVAASGLR